MSWGLFLWYMCVKLLCLALLVAALLYHTRRQKLNKKTEPQPGPSNKENGAVQVYLLVDVNFFIKFPGPIVMGALLYYTIRETLLRHLEAQLAGAQRHGKQRATGLCLLKVF